MMHRELGVNCYNLSDRRNYVVRCTDGSLFEVEKNDWSAGNIVRDLSTDKIKSLVIVDCWNVLQCTRRHVTLGDMYRFKNGRPYRNTRNEIKLYFKSIDSGTSYVTTPREQYLYPTNYKTMPIRFRGLVWINEPSSHLTMVRLSSQS